MTVSVIVPVYNVEKYLPRCVESVLAQTMKDFELILVDDGSPDGCPQLCDAYARQDGRVRVVHKPNGGLASARNAGLDVAEGTYILFVDSDDWIDPETLEQLVRVAETYGTDFVRFRPMYAGWPGKEDGSLCDFGTERGMREGLYERAQIRAEILPQLFATPELTLGVIVSACRSLYRHAFLRENGLRFDDDVRYSEDTIFSARLVMATERFYYLDGPRYYHYFFNPGSITRSFRADRWLDHKRLIGKFEQAFANRTDYDFTDQLWLQKIFCIVSALGQRDTLPDLRQRRAYCKEICEDDVTVRAMRHCGLVRGSRRMRLYLCLIRWKQSRLIARI